MKNTLNIHLPRSLLCLAGLGLLATQPLFAKNPNLIVILTDDQGYNDVGFNGGTEIPTPHIDTIASNGIRFTNGYVSYSVCGPSRAGLLTGRYQDRFGFTRNPTIDPSVPHAGIPLEEKNIAEVLSPTGYQSMIIGKWHMGSHPQNHPLNRGFDEFYGFLAGGHQYFPSELTLNDLSEVSKKWEWYRTKLLRDHTRVEETEYLTDAFSREAVSFVERQACSEKPFFLYLAYNAPHAPLQATEKYLKRFKHIKDKKRRTYAAMVSAVDDGVGLLLNALEEKELMEDTIIIFLSDNGGSSKNASDNTPLRDWKASLFEGGVRVPFAIQWKNHLPAGVDYDHPVISLDILPTIAELSGSPVSSERPLDGVNLIPFLTGEKEERPHEQLFWRTLQNDDWAIRKGDIKLVRSRTKEKKADLYDLARDMVESTDLSSSMKKEKNELQTAWDNWEAQLKPLAFPANNYNWWD
ncbi:sulfatase-like hydrolase/transferase [Puniceicoccales bacterium CK1056]|uniref:Sulfatase-like hydrolase/transferase n=1 Tax=Oceanipulchritudo coccoides TaxID=2706888 RepID=A0A6B2LYL1_9BACT|nr:sulfatase-like hydrolase/transferase [Oceanipulchritudo coccoides]NDV61493.1 sulfatase-like hydrolase/transferase [Oceanipulchritudo coccoides]